MIPARSILKEGTYEQDQRNYKVALQHAVKLQSRKEAESRILQSIIALIDLPASNNFAPSEAVAFLEHVARFQPSDYDSLVVERCIEAKCGYALCSNKPRNSELVSKIDPGYKDWCSEKCARKGLYVRAQLDNVPVWERLPTHRSDIQLHPDDQTKLQQATSVVSTKNHVAGVTNARRTDQIAQAEHRREDVPHCSINGNRLRRLADDKEVTTESFRRGQVLSDIIIEKSGSSMAKPPSLSSESKADFNAIEGYLPV